MLHSSDAALTLNTRNEKQSHQRYANCIAVIQGETKLNVETCSRQLKPHSCQTHQPKIDLPIADSHADLRVTKRRIRQTPPYAPPQIRLHFLPPELPPSVLNLIFPYRTKGALVQSRVKDIGYYISSGQTFHCSCTTRFVTGYITTVFWEHGSIHHEVNIRNK
jgi:hypothetical protein